MSPDGDGTLTIGTTAFSRATGWRPRVSVDDGLARLHAWVQEAITRPQQAPRAQQQKVTSTR